MKKQTIREFSESVGIGALLVVCSEQMSGTMVTTGQLFSVLALCVVAYAAKKTIERRRKCLR